MKAIACFVVLSCLLLGFSAAVELRTWTDVQDRKFEATLLRLEGKNAVLQRKDGREVRYPLGKLCAEDVKYIEENRASLSSETPGKSAGPSAEKPGKSTAPSGEMPGKNKVESGKEFNFESAWPQTIKVSDDPEITTVEESPENKRFIYESANYRYVCDVRLTKAVVRGFALRFEATYQFCRSLPLAINGGAKAGGKQQILLFKEKDDYVKAGGPAGSAGVFISGRGVVIVPLTSLGVKPFGSGYMLDRGKDNDTLSHELTHQLTPKAYFKKGARGWFSEGLAEYVATTPYQLGTFHVHNNQKEIIEYVTGTGSKNQGGRSLGTRIKLPPLKSFMLQDYDSFLKQSQLSYGGALLLTDYFFHMDGDGDGKRIKAFLKALQENQDGEKALEQLTDGRSFEKLQADFAKAWKHKGIDFTFASE